MGLRDRSDVYGDNDGERRDKREQRDEQPRKRHFNGIVRCFDQRSRRTVIVEFSPDTTEELEALGSLVHDQRDLTVDRCVALCQEAGVRARVLMGGQYVGHIFADGSCDKGVQNFI